MASSILIAIQTQFTLYGYSISMILGNIGNVFIVILFGRQHQNACSIYLISSAIMNIVYLTSIGINQLFPYNYNDGTIRTIILCKIFTYLPNFLGQVAKTILILTCIDRYMITSTNATF
jgi:hypothetical protein